MGLAVIEIARHGSEVLDQLRPLWLTMVRHHGEVTPEMGPVRDEEESWTRRRAHYERQLGRDGAFVLVALQEGCAVGYALVTMEGESETWADPGSWAEIDSLALLSEARGQGIGTRLVERVYEETGGAELRLQTMASNAGALRFYERLGFETIVHVLRKRPKPPE